MLLKTPFQRRDKRPALQLLVHAGVFACGLAGGLVELLALQRSRFRQRLFQVPGGRHRPD